MRLFIAVDIPYMKKIEELQSSISGKVKFVEPENMHLTLKFLGEVSESAVPEIEKRMQRCRAEKMVLTLKNVGFFPNERYIRVVWIGVEHPEPLVSLMQCMDNALNELGFKREKSYMPHLTVARAKGPVHIKHYDTYKNAEFGVVPVSKIKLKKSTLTPSGPIYQDIYVMELL